MEKKLLKIIIGFLISAQLSGFKSVACGWYEYDDTYRISMFRAEIPELFVFRPFYYTPDLWNTSYPELANTDWEKNCREWQSDLSKNVELRDIYTILYKINPDVFFLAYDDGKLKEFFEGNTFIEFLLLPNNKEWLDYLVFAKQNEFNNQFIDDPWGDSYYSETGSISYDLIPTAEKLVNEVKNEKLRNRYAYQLIRLYRQTGENQECIATYDKYFSKVDETSVLRNWALLHKAEALNALGKKIEANYLYSLVFNQCDEKKRRTYQFFSKSLINQTLILAKNKEEIAGIWALSALQNPGPALTEMKKVFENDPNHSAIPILVMREVNKLEDWLFTPELTSHSPSLKDEEHQGEWEEDYAIIKEKNKKKDLEYLNELNSFLSDIKSKANPNLIDYLNLAQAHLYLIARENKKALELFNLIGNKANSTIQLQKNTELVLYYSFENEIVKDDVKEMLAKTLSELEKLGAKNPTYLKQIHSLCEVVSRAFNRNGDIATAGLLKTRAEDFKNDFEQSKKEEYWSYGDRGYYWQIAYYDRFASIQDIDKLLILFAKKNKNNFEKFLCNQELPTKNALLDLKGTLALRIGDFKTANEAFSSMPHDYWEKNYEYKSFLRHNPFIAPNLPVDTNYVFNKADLLKQIVNLMDEANRKSEKKAANFIKIGQFLYNSSYWGNSWMMMSYSWTSIPQYQSTAYGYYDVLFGNMNDNARNYMDNYYYCKLALNYFQEAEKNTKDKELLAMITFMKHCCSYDDYLWQEMKRGWDEKPGVYTPLYIKDLYTKYNKTNTFEQVHCALMDDYAMGLGLY